MPDLASRENPYNVTQASRIYFLPNLMTAGNLFCGFVAVIKCIQARLEAIAPGTYAPHSPSDLYTSAVWFILAAVVFDSLDGRLARLGGRESLFGAEFDSLADVITFGVAPALMVFFLILSPTQGYPLFRQIGWFIGFIYLLCAAVRLARFNVITNPLLHSPKDSSKDFVGLPVPAAAGTVVSLVLLLLHLSVDNLVFHRLALALPISQFQTSRLANQDTFSDIRDHHHRGLSHLLATRGRLYLPFPRLHFLRYPPSFSPCSAYFPYPPPTKTSGEETCWFRPITLVKSSLCE
jgi:CDP-diacylglycerol---serine O-phosphatidyltransferase